MSIVADSMVIDEATENSLVRSTQSEMMKTIRHSFIHQQNEEWISNIIIVKTSVYPTRYSYYPSMEARAGRDGYHDTRTMMGDTLTQQIETELEQSERKITATASVILDSHSREINDD